MAVVRCNRWKEISRSWWFLARQIALEFGMLFSPCRMWLTLLKMPWPRRLGDHVGLTGLRWFSHSSWFLMAGRPSPKGGDSAFCNRTSRECNIAISSQASWMFRTNNGEYGSPFLRGQSNLKNAVPVHGPLWRCCGVVRSAKVIERGERIDSLLDKTAALKSESA